MKIIGKSNSKPMKLLKNIEKLMKNQYPGHSPRPDSPARHPGQTPRPVSPAPRPDQSVIKLYSKISDFGAPNGQVQISFKFD